MSTRSEIRTFAELSHELGPLGYSISQNYRVLDAIGAAAANPEAVLTVGPSVADVFLPAIREGRGPLGSSHPWLRPGDWSFAFKSSFDFVVLAPLGERWQTIPLFAVEFDGPCHARPVAQTLDLRKNRLCAASGLPLLRIDSSFLQLRDRLSLLAWLAQLWAAHRREMPKLLAERDAQVARIHELAEGDAGVEQELFEDPSLDVDFLFRLMHPFPPIEPLLVHLARRHGVQWSYQQSHISPEAQDDLTAFFARQKPRWRVSGWRPDMPLKEGQPWNCTVWLEGVGGESVQLTGSFEGRSHYPLGLEDRRPDWIDFFLGEYPVLFAGPWPGAPSVIGDALCTYNTLREISAWLRRNDRT